MPNDAATYDYANSANRMLREVTPPCNDRIGSWSCENILAEALRRRDSGEVAVLVILPSLAVFPSGMSP